MLILRSQLDIYVFETWHRIIGKIDILLVKLIDPFYRLFFSILESLVINGGNITVIVVFIIFKHPIEKLKVFGIVAKDRRTVP